MNKLEFARAIKEFRPDLKITNKEVTYFFNIYKGLIRIAKKDPKRFAVIKSTYKVTNINTRKFRDLLAERLLIELTPRQAEIYVDILTMVIIDENNIL